ncbi:MAG: hypothetical protein JWL59_4374 [Chthoniobacteraceae bacterium]|nr:hypothetical protein [Chthoniobacteraceae bacterium]
MTKKIKQNLLGYTKISLKAMNDPCRFSLRSIGLLHCLLSKPNTWLTVEDLEAKNPDSRPAIQKALQKLLVAGYVACKPECEGIKPGIRRPVYMARLEKAY